MLIHIKDDIEFVTEFPCLLGHPVFKTFKGILNLYFIYLSILPTFQQLGQVLQYYIHSIHGLTGQ